jgi:tetratricopeptide (TPR) repeat protein
MFAVLGILMALGVVALIIFLIVFPPYFRGLEPRYQVSIIHRFPPATYWMKPLDSTSVELPGGASSEQDALDLLNATMPGQSTGAGLSEGQVVEQLSSATPTATSEGIPVGVVATPIPTLLPMDTPQASAMQPTWTPMIEPTAVSLPPSVLLTGIRYESQGWNNCGPTTMTMALSYFGWPNHQEMAANWMKPNTEDKNVSPWQMVRFVYENTGLKALFRYGGTTVLLRRLLASNFPVVIEKGFQPAGEDWMGHYLLLVGYDDTTQQFLAYDSYLGNNYGRGIAYSYSELDDYWRHFNRVFLVVYEPSREMELRQALGDYVDLAYSYRTALETARAEASQNREDKWAWFNMGTSYNLLGYYEDAAAAYDQAIRLNLPWRMLWYQFGPYEAYFHMGRYSDILALAQGVLANTPYVEETYFWQGMVSAAQNDLNGAVSEFNQTLRYNRNFFPAQDAIAQIEAGTFQVASTGQ